MTIGLKGNVDGSGAIQVGGSDAITISTGLVVTMNGGAVYPLSSATAVASTSGTSIDFTGIPSTVKRITVMFNGVSLSGTSNILVQIGGSGGVENTGYVARGGTILDTGSITILDSTAGFPIRLGAAVNLFYGVMYINLISSNQFCASYSGTSGATNVQTGGGSKTLSGTLTQVRITTVNGTDTFDAGSVNILWE